MKGVAKLREAHIGLLGDELGLLLILAPSDGAVFLGWVQVAEGRQKVFERSEFFCRLNSAQKHGVSPEAGVCFL